VTTAVRPRPRLQPDHVYGRLAELARRRHRKSGKTAAGKALLANLRASSLGERRPSDHEMSTWDKVPSLLTYLLTGLTWLPVTGGYLDLETLTFDLLTLK